MNTEKNHTICCISTPKGEGAIAMIRISGYKSIKICHKIFSCKQIKHQKDFIAKKSLFGKIKDGQKIIDEVILIYYKAPNSYTGEDLIEISCHGSKYIQKTIIELLIKNGCLLAKNGELTLRAFLNGKLDLSQAEAVSNLISSENEKSHELAIKQMRGGYSDEIRKIRSELIKFSSLIELELDFSTEDVEFADRKKLQNLLEIIEEKTKSIALSFKYGNVIKNGIPIAIVGPPNSGKSTLLNKMLKEDRAIVSNIKGTTRDSIEEIMVINGLTFRFIDTAGLRKTDDEIEKIGIQRTYEKIKQSAIIIYVFDINNFDKKTLQKELTELEKYQEEMIIVANKSDLSKRKLALKNTNQKLLYTSFLKDQGLNKIQSFIIQKVEKWKYLNDSIIITNERHFEAFTNTLKYVSKIKNSISENVSGELVSQDIKMALHHLGEITGEISNEDLLDSIFRDFCIGK